MRLMCWISMTILPGDTVRRLGSKSVDQSLKSTPDEWLSQYFYAAGNIKTAQLKFWMQATA